MHETTRRGLMGIGAIVLAALSCRPVFAIGYQEILLIIVLLAILLGPLLFRVYRIFSNLQKGEAEEARERRKRK